MGTSDSQLDSCLQALLPAPLPNVSHFCNSFVRNSFSAQQWRSPRSSVESRVRRAGPQEKRATEPRVTLGGVVIGVSLKGKRGSRMGWLVVFASAALGFSRGSTGLTLIGFACEGEVCGSWG